MAADLHSGRFGSRASAEMIEDEFASRLEGSDIKFCKGRSATRDVFLPIVRRHAVSGSRGCGDMKRPGVFTIGHSTRTIEEFVELLHAHGVRGIVDIRSIPRSRHNPQFNADLLGHSLAQKHIFYQHIGELGGLRHASKDSINLGWRNASFRGYADYMATEEFSEGLDLLMKIARIRATAIMCAEAIPWRCHRSLLGDALTKKGWMVRDIMSHSVATRHLLTPFLKTRKGQLVYPEGSVRGA